MNSAPQLSQLEDVFSSVVGAMLAMGAFALFIMFLVGGFKFITSGGDPKMAEEAKKTLTYAIGGMVLLAISFMILNIIGTITGAPVTEFNITR